MSFKKRFDHLWKEATTKMNENHLIFQKWSNELYTEIMKLHGSLPDGLDQPMAESTPVRNNNFALKREVVDAGYEAAENPVRPSVQNDLLPPTPETPTENQPTARIKVEFRGEALEEPAEQAPANQPAAANVPANVPAVKQEPGPSQDVKPFNGNPVRGEPADQQNATFTVPPAIIQQNSPAPNVPRVVVKQEPQDPPAEEAAENNGDQPAPVRADVPLLQPKLEPVEQPAPVEENNNREEENVPPQDTPPALLQPKLEPSQDRQEEAHAGEANAEEDMALEANEATPPQVANIRLKRESAPVVQPTTPTRRRASRAPRTPKTPKNNKRPAPTGDGSVEPDHRYKLRRIAKNIARDETDAEAPQERPQSNLATLKIGVVVDPDLSEVIIPKIDLPYCLKVSDSLVCLKRAKAIVVLTENNKATLDHIAVNTSACLAIYNKGKVKLKCPRRKKGIDSLMKEALRVWSASF